MKLDIRDDFTRLPRALSIIRAAEAGASGQPADSIALQHDERHLRRKALPLSGGGRILVDLPEPVQLAHGDRLVLEDGRQVEIAASPEDLYAIRARSPLHLAELCWHIGNRHLALQIDNDRLLILRDHVIRDMLAGLGAKVADVVEPFQPLRGAYSGHAHAHHGHDHHKHNH